MSAKRPHLRTLTPQLRSAIEALTWPHHTYINNQRRTAPSLYQQLTDAIPGTQGSGGNGYRSLPALWIDAVDTLKHIDYTVTQWLPMHGETTHTRLHLLHRIQSWKEHDTDFLTTAINDLTGWAARIDNLLDPTPVKDVSAPCPTCGATHVYRQDSGGDNVRIAALQITTRGGCTCQACKASWAPDLLPFLAHQLLGFPLPEGVLQ